MSAQTPAPEALVAKWRTENPDQVAELEAARG